MEQRPLGTTGMTVSALGFGCGSGGGLLVRGEPRDQRDVVARALEAGVTYFDTAPSYGDGASETNLGRVLRELDARAGVAIGTKVRLDPGADPSVAVRTSVTASLRRLGTERVELVQLHNRLGGGERELAGGRLADVVGALEDLRSEGLTRAIGCTAMGDSEAVVSAVRSGAFAAAQCYVNAANPSAAAAGVAGGAQDFRGVIGEAASRGMGVLAIRVFAAGALAGPLPRAPVAGDPGGAPMAGADYASDVRRADALGALVREHALESALELSLRFVLGIDGVSSALIGFSNRAQLEDALRWTHRGAIPAAGVLRGFRRPLA